MLKRFRNYLVAGLFVILPAVATGYIVRLVFVMVDGLLGSVIGRLIHRRIPGLGLVATLILLILAGALATNYFGKRIIVWVEGLLIRIPVIGGIYGTTRQFAEALSSQDRGFFRRVVLLQYPRPGIYAVGFLTGEAPEALAPSGRELINVFVPTVPNPTTGFLVHVPADDVIYPALSVDEGIKLVISAGVVKPSRLDRD